MSKSSHWVKLDPQTKELLDALELVFKGKISRQHIIGMGLQIAAKAVSQAEKMQKEATSQASN